MRKCLLMGFAAFFQPGSLLQLIIVMVLTVCYAVVLSKFAPYRDPVDDTLARVLRVEVGREVLLGASASIPRDESAAVVVRVCAKTETPPQPSAQRPL